MDKIAVIYWSGTGNTEKMAESIVEGIKSAGAEADLSFCTDFDMKAVDQYEKFAFGCPSMGDEVLEEAEFDPFFEEIEKHLSGKKVILFGSYGWGDGEWMEDWEERVRNSDAYLFDDGLILNEEPDDDGLTECVDLGKNFAKC